VDQGGLDRIDVIEGTHVPRATADDDERPYVLLRPSEGVIGVTALYLVPAGTIIEQ
jgi:hypothetical protein